MRVLWFTGIPMPAVDRRTGKNTTGSCHWMKELVEALRSEPGVELGVATAYQGLKDCEFEEGGVRYYVVGQPRYFPHHACRPSDLEACRSIVRRFSPDVIHVHGTERFYGLLAARRLVDEPVVISLQGILSACLRDFFGSLGVRDRVAATRLVEFATRRGLYWGYAEYKKGARQEDEILRGAPAFMGRTAWDKAQVRACNDAARYWHVGELLRPAFSEKAWDLGGCRRERVFVTNVGNPRRGTETVLDALAVLARRRPAVRLALAGGLPPRSGYGRWLRARIERSGLGPRVELLGHLDSPALARELRSSHAYVMASHVENSPNSLCEAQRVGLPCVATHAGGIPSLVDDGGTGLLVPRGDPAMLAARLEEILGGDLLAMRLGAAARAAAAARHEPRHVLGQLLDAYRGEIEAAAGRAAAAGVTGTAALGGSPRQVGSTRSD